MSFDWTKRRNIRVSHYQMTYIEMLNLIPNSRRAHFNRDFRRIMYGYLPITHDKRILQELSFSHPELKKLIAKRR